MAPITVAKGRPSGLGSDSNHNNDSNTAAAAKSNATKSFSQMPDSDLESIGRNCEFDYCGQLDFLPFRCESCRKTFCLEHRTEMAHKCAKAGEWARRRNNSNTSTTTAKPTSSSLPTQKPSIYNSKQCSHLSCKALIDTLTGPAVRCPNCNRQYCLRHRLQEEHDCAKVAPLGARAGRQQQGGERGGSQNASETLRSMFARVRTWGKDSSNSGGAGGKVPQTTSSTATRKPASALQSRGSGGSGGGLNALKRSAKGDANIPADKRIYLHVVGCSDNEEKTEPPSGEFFFDSRWKVGRILDDAAKRLRVENLNNRGAGEEMRLRIFHVESGEFLEFSEGIGAGKVKQGHTIVLLRGAGVVMGKS